MDRGSPKNFWREVDFSVRGLVHRIEREGIDVNLKADASVEPVDLGCGQR